MMQKRGLALLIFLFFFFSGCFSMEVSHTIDPDGSSFVSIIVNTSAILDEVNLNSTLDTNSSNMTFDSGCAQYENNSLFSCTELDFAVIRLEATTTVPITEVKSLQETRYTYDALYVFDILQQISDNPDEQVTRDSLAEIKILNSEYTYIVQMPGTILSTEIGDIFENAVIIDIFDLENAPSATITSIVEEPLPWDIIGMIGGGILAVIIFIVLLFAGLTHKSHPKPDANEIACKSYIEQYKNTYSAEQLKQGLVASGHDPVKASEYVQKYYS